MRARGLPVVATRHGGIADVVRDNETGFLVDEHDVRSMARAMVRLANDPDLAGRLGTAGRKHACADYSMEKSIGGLRRILEDATKHAAQ